MTPALAIVPAHGHCEICQTPVAVGDRFCGAKECDAKHQQNVRDKKRQVWTMIAVIVAAVLLANLVGLR